MSRYKLGDVLKPIWSEGSWGDGEYRVIVLHDHGRRFIGIRLHSNPHDQATSERATDLSPLCWQLCEEEEICLAVQTR